MKGSAPRCGGFTLLEMVFVVFLFMLLVGFSSSRFRRSFDTLSLDVAARDLLDSMRLAHDRAILEGVPYAVHVSPAQQAYWLFQGTAKSATRKLPMGVVVHGDETSVLFSPDGTSSSASFQLIGRDEQKTIAVEPMTGGGSVRENS